MSRIILGLMRIDQMKVEEVEALVLDAINEGITFFDLADIYGSTKCETLFGEVIKRHKEIRNKIYIQTKIGIIPGHGYDLSYEYIIKSAKESIKRLNVTYLDSLLLHRPDIFMDAEEVTKAVEYLQKEGLIKDFGVSNFTQSEIEYLQKYLKTPIKYNQVQLGIGNTTMLDQVMYTNIPSNLVSKEADSLYFFLKKENIIVQCWSPYLYGFFEGSIFDENKYPLINQVLAEYANKYHTSKCGIATAFLLVLNKTIMVISGSTNINHLKEALDGEKINLSKKDWYDIYHRIGKMLP